MTNITATRPIHAVLLADLTLYLLALKDRRPDIAVQVRRAIQEGRYYEQN